MWRGAPLQQGILGEDAGFDKCHEESFDYDPQVSCPDFTVKGADVRLGVGSSALVLWCERQALHIASACEGGLSALGTAWKADMRSPACA